ncbi:MULTISPECIES: hypothetical protein [unclassified Frankia]|uniref:hypothetical protein n=1 Tax=unclassified Frankia TaxID=2632575 RepID=UPI001EF4A9C0|nr:MULTISPECIES: hypothetical protein [unclassified Frankia]
MGRVSVRAEQNTFRGRMLDAGMTHADVADEFIRRYRLRPRAAFRYAHGWTLLQAAAHINGDAARLDLDPHGRAPMTGSRLSELEHWPDTTARRRLTPQILALLATAYGTDVHSLLDVRDHTHMRAADLLVIDTMMCIGQPAACLCGQRRTPAAARPRVPRPRPDTRARPGSSAVTATPLPVR